MLLGETFLVGRERHESGGATAQRLERRRTMGNEVASAKRARRGQQNGRRAAGTERDGPPSAPGPALPPRCRRWTRRLQGRELGSGRARCAAARCSNCTPQTEGHRLRDTARPLGMWRQRAKKKEKEKDSRARRHGSSLGATRSTPGGDALVCQRKLELRIFT